MKPAFSLSGRGVPYKIIGSAGSGSGAVAAAARCGPAGLAVGCWPVVPRPRAHGGMYGTYVQDCCWRGGGHESKGRKQADTTSSAPSGRHPLGRRDGRELTCAYPMAKQFVGSCQLFRQRAADRSSPLGPHAAHLCTPCSPPVPCGPVALPPFR